MTRRTLVAIGLLTSYIAGPPAPAQGQKIYWTVFSSTAKKVQRADLDGSGIEDLVTGLVSPLGIALDVAGGKMYWAEPNGHSITRANLDGTSVEPVVTGTPGFPTAIALDVASGKMYWTESGSEKAVRRANLDGSSIEDLVFPDVQTNRNGIALDLSAGKIYWTRCEKIRRSNLDGSVVEDIVVTTSHCLTEIALDVPAGKIYWADPVTSEIQRANFDGSLIEKLITTGLDFPAGIVLDLGSGQMYWADRNTQKIQRANLDGSNIVDLVTGVGGLWGIALDLSLPDCNENGVDDPIDITNGTSPDCNTNGIPDECDIDNCPQEETACQDCNGNGVPDECDIPPGQVAAAGPAGGAAALGTIQIDPFYSSDYGLIELGAVPDLPTPYGGLTFLAGDTNTLLIGGDSNESIGKLYTIQVVRDAQGHVTGFSGTATVYADAAYNDGGVTYGPNNVLFLTRWPVNELGQTKFGSGITDKIIDLDPHGVDSSISGLMFVPNGFGGAGRLKIVTFEVGFEQRGYWYDATVTSDGSGTFDLVGVVQTALIVGGPEGFVYVAAGNAQFPVDSMLVSEWTDDKVATYEIDSNGDPIVATRRDFITGLDGAEGALIDPVTGDFLFSTFVLNGDNVVIAVRGFLPPGSSDCNNNGIPDECEPDCDGNGVPDECETDTDNDGVPDACERGACCDTTLENRPCFEQRLEANCPQGYTWTEDTACATVGCTAIPTISEWGLIILTLTLLAAGTVVIRRVGRGYSLDA